MSRKMKDSGIEWVGEIPEEWEVKCLKHISADEPNSIVDGPFGSDMKNEEYVDDGIPIIQLNNIGDGIHKLTNLKFLTPEKAFQLKRHSIYPGEIVIAKMMPSGRAAIVSSAFEKYIVSSDSIRLKLNSENEHRFISYCLNAYAKNEAEIQSTGTTRVRINLSIAKNLHFAVTSIEEQVVIANYLDYKCVKIDEIIESQKQMIEKLKKYKQSVITEAVTKGLNPDVPMKDSGIEWIGEIPEHWELHRLKSILAIPMQYGANDSGEEFDESEPRYIRITDITMDNKLKDEGKLSLPLDRAKPYLLDDEDILFARSGATVGKSFIYKKEFGLSAFAGYLIRAKFNEKALPQYVFYYTLSNNYIEWKNRIFIQATIQNIGANKYSNMEIVVPLKEEQKEIIQYLDKKCSHIDNVIAKKETLIEKLTDYKKSLIYECVTGKREV